MDAPLVTICCIAFNQESYISQTIEGFLTQKTNFAFEVLIHDDASTDNTAKIIRQYAEKHPKLIKPIFQKENQWSKGVSPSQNFVWPKVRSKYMALCEGDDYWVDTNKLQKQVDFLEKHPDFGLVYTKTKLFNQQKGKLISRKSPSKMHPEGILFYNPIPTLTTLFKTDLMKSYLEMEKENINKWPMKDYPMWIWIYYHSKIHFLEETTSVYRVLNTSASHFTDGEKRMDFMESSFDMTKYFAEKFLDNNKYLAFLEFKYRSLYKAAILYKTDRHKKYYNFLSKLKNKKLSTILFLILFERLYIRKLYTFFLKSKLIRR